MRIACPSEVHGAVRRALEHFGGQVTNLRDVYLFIREELGLHIPQKLIDVVFSPASSETSVQHERSYQPYFQSADPSYSGKPDVSLRGRRRSASSAYKTPFRPAGRPPIHGSFSGRHSLTPSQHQGLEASASRLHQSRAADTRFLERILEEFLEQAKAREKELLEQAKAREKELLDQAKEIRLEEQQRESQFRLDVLRDDESLGQGRALDFDDDEDYCSTMPEHQDFYDEDCCSTISEHQDFYDSDSYDFDD